MGPLVSARQAERAAGFVTGAKAAGATVLTGGERLGDAATFMAPTVIVDVHAGMEIVREEAFGPVLVAQVYDEIEEATAAANDSQYGLAASVWTESLSSAHRLSGALRAGTVWINGHAMYDGKGYDSGWCRAALALGFLPAK